MKETTLLARNRRDSSSSSSSSSNKLSLIIGGAAVIWWRMFECNFTGACLVRVDDCFSSAVKGLWGNDVVNTVAADYPKIRSIPLAESITMLVDTPRVVCHSRARKNVSRRLRRISRRRCLAAILDPWRHRRPWDHQTMRSGVLAFTRTHYQGNCLQGTHALAWQLNICAWQATALSPIQRTGTHQKRDQRHDTGRNFMSA
jgi:hypothetical protein